MSWLEDVRDAQAASARASAEFLDQFLEHCAQAELVAESIGDHQSVDQIRVLLPLARMARDQQARLADELAGPVPA